MAKKMREDERGRFTTQDLTAGGRSQPGAQSAMPWRGYNPGENGRNWSLPSGRHSAYGRWVEEQLPDYATAEGTLARLDALDANGFIWWSGSSWPRLKKYTQGLPSPSAPTDPPEILGGEVVCADNLEAMAALPAGSVDLIYTDPPYATGRDFGAYDDRWDSLDGYLAYMEPRLAAMRRLLRPGGSVYVQCDTKANGYLRVMMDKIWGRASFRNEIVWCYSSPSHTRYQFPRKSDRILFYTQPGAAHTFNADAVRVPYKDGRIHPGGGGIFQNGHNYERLAQLEAMGKVPEDWWPDIPPLTGANEMVGYPTQKPEALAERIIRASSNEGDVVLDCFAGSGTTLVAARKLGRRYYGIDINPEAVTHCRDRLAADDCVHQRELVFV